MGSDQKETDLKSTLSVFQTIIETMEEGVAIVDPEENFSYANLAAAKLFEIPNNQLPGHNLSEFLSVDSINFIKNQTSLRIKGETSIYRLEIITLSGNKKTIQVTAIPKFTNKTFDGTFGIFKDITEQIKNEEIISKTEEKYRLLVETMNEGLLIINTTADIVYVNLKFQEILKTPSNDLIGQNVSKYLCPESLPLVLQEFEKRKMGLKGNYEAQLQLNIHEIIPIQIASSPIFDEKGNFEGAVALITDLTERKKTELALVKSEARFRKIMEFLPDIVSILNKDGQLVYNSPASSRIHGYSSKEFENLKTMDLVHPDDLKGFIEAFSKVLKFPDDITSKQYRYRNKDGSYTWMEAMATNNLKDPTLEGIITVSRDITERKVAEEKINKMLEELSDANLMKDRFFSIIAHDLINPFNSLLGLSQLLSKNADKYEPEKIKHFSNMIHESAKNGYKLLENLLDWSRTQTNRFEFDPYFYPLGELIDESIEIIEGQLLTKEMQIIKNFDPFTSVYTDKNVINTILRNLISNAIKFSPIGSKIEISSYFDPKYCIVSIRDYGTGIPENKIHKLFQLNSNYSTAGTLNEKGTGLGLILCKEFVEKQEGQIWVESKINEGSIFHFSIPLAKPENSIKNARN